MVRCAHSALSPPSPADISLAYTGLRPSRTFLCTSHPAQDFPSPGGKLEIPEHQKPGRQGLEGLGILEVLCF